MKGLFKLNETFVRDASVQTEYDQFGCLVGLQIYRKNFPKALINVTVDTAATSAYGFEVKFDETHGPPLALSAVTSTMRNRVRGVVRKRQSMKLS